MNLRGCERAEVSHQEQEIPGAEVNPAGLLPRDLAYLAYYMYEGSVTAPPCTEGVTWYVLKIPVDICSIRSSSSRDSMRAT